LHKAERPDVRESPKHYWPEMTKGLMGKIIEIAQARQPFLPPYAPDCNPVEYLWAWLKHHALANFCPATLRDLKIVARNKLKSAQHRQSIIMACWKQAKLW
jgi:transposase